jgi:predicted ester cyclase
MTGSNKQLAFRWFDEVWNKKNTAAIDSMMAPNSKCWGFPQADSCVIGVEAFKEVHRNFVAAFPDLRVTLEDIINDGDKTAVRFRATMTHLGDHLGFAATGKAVVLTGCSIFIGDGSQILEGWNYMDIGSMIQSLQAV